MCFLGFGCFSVALLQSCVLLYRLQFAYKERSKTKVKFSLCALENDHFKCVFSLLLHRFLKFPFFPMGNPVHIALLFCLRLRTSNICTFSAFSGRQKHQTNNAQRWCDFCYTQNLYIYVCDSTGTQVHVKCDFLYYTWNCAPSPFHSLCVCVCRL